MIDWLKRKQPAPHRRTGMGLCFQRVEPFAWKMFWQRPKTIVKLLCPTHPQVIVSKYSGFRALYLARQNEFCLFRLINTFFFIFGSRLLPEKFSFCPKNNNFVKLRELGGWSPLARTPIMQIMFLALTKKFLSLSQTTLWLAPCLVYSSLRISISELRRITRYKRAPDRDEYTRRSLTSGRQDKSYSIYMYTSGGPRMGPEGHRPPKSCPGPLNFFQGNFKFRPNFSTCQSSAIETV